MLLVLLFSPIGGFGQSFNEDLDAVVNKVSAADSYTIESTVKIYGKKGGSLDHQIKASVMATKSASYTVIGEVEMLQTTEQVLVIDRDEKIIEVENIPASKQSKKNKNASALKLDELEKLAAKESGLQFKLTNTSGNIRTYTASNTKLGIKSLVIKLDFVDKKLISYVLEQLDEEGNAGQYVVMDYTTFSFAIDSPELLKINHFVTIEGNSYKPSGAFKDFTIIKK